MTSRTQRQPVVLAVGYRPRLAEWLQGVLERNGIALVHAETAPQALAHLRMGGVDLILLDSDRDETDALAVCRQLRADPDVGPHTPILFTAAVERSRTQRLAALRAGAWDVLSTPLDTEELLLRVNAYARQKVAIDLALAEALVDPETGLYNVQGLARRARELGHLAHRQRSPLAAVVLAPDLPDPAARDASTVARCAQWLRTVTRSSDAIGRVSATEFAILAPATDADGAERLVRRVTGELEAKLQEGGERRLEFRIGVDVGNVAYAPVDGMDLLGRANLAERRARGAPGARIRERWSTGPRSA